MPAAGTALVVGGDDPGNVQRWVLRDRGYLDRRSGMRHARRRRRPCHLPLRRLRRLRQAIDDGRLVGRALRSVDLRGPTASARALAAYEDPRRDHTKFRSAPAGSPSRRSKQEDE
jgi:hypothetical protein